MSKTAENEKPFSEYWYDDEAGDSSGLEEIRHGIMDSHLGVPELISLDLQTGKTGTNWRYFLAREFGQEERDAYLGYPIKQEPWETPRETELVRFRPKDVRATSERDLELSERDAASCNANSDWVSSPDEILNRLEGTHIPFADRITAVLFAETTAFEEGQKPRLLRALFEFSEQHRYSKDDEITTAVGSAIRKFAMNMPTSEFESYARLFLPTTTDTMSSEIELELAKAVGWRLVKVKTTKAGKYPNLETRLSELASDYLRRRLILQKSYASIVIHAVIAVALLNGERQRELVDRIVNLRINWFSDLFARRLLDVIDKRQATESADVGNLTRLHKRLIAATRR